MSSSRKTRAHTLMSTHITHKQDGMHSVSWRVFHGFSLNLESMWCQADNITESMGHSSLVTDNCICNDNDVDDGVEMVIAIIIIIISWRMLLGQQINGKETEIGTWNWWVTGMYTRNRKCVGMERWQLSALTMKPDWRRGISTQRAVVQSSWERQDAGRQIVLESKGGW